MSSAKHSFVRVGNPNVQWQVLVRDDSRYAILPIISTLQVEQIDAWQVYDTKTGQIITPPEGPFPTYVTARNWINKEYPA